MNSDESERTPPHRYNTRSSPASALYKMRVDINVKETVCARDHSGKRLAPYVFEAATSSSMRTQIFDHCAPQMRSKASYVDDPRMWTVDDSPPTHDDFDSFKPTSDGHAQRYLMEHQNQTFTIIVFKWGNLIKNANDLQQFQVQCIQVPIRDREGAVAESMHQTMATWRMWAAGILKKSLHLHSSLAAMPPPSNMLRLFERVATAADELIPQVQQNLHLSSDTVDSCLEDLVVLKDATKELVRRVETMIESMKSKKRIIEAISCDVRRNSDENIADAIHSIPNAKDTDHAEE
ncbi:hypothetical protein AC1031_011426 [Aphanomyces cochlioides]|nr:hypothetical protein AC1031_011426 [Aphanomyces cochlioides]